jgi:hypothetical protein
LSPHPAKTAWPILTIYTSNDAVSYKELPLGILTHRKTPNWFISQKTPQNWAINGDFHVKQKPNNFSTIHVISAQISSIGAACQKILAI